jgi:hypothetical protein
MTAPISTCIRPTRNSTQSSSIRLGRKYLMSWSETSQWPRQRMSWVSSSEYSRYRRPSEPIARRVARLVGSDRLGSRSTVRNAARPAAATIGGRSQPPRSSLVSAERAVVATVIIR